MPHFASANIDAVSGRVASLKKTAIAQRLTSGNGAVEGSDLLTYTTPNDGVARRYLLLAYVKVGTVSNNTGTDVVKVQCSYNDAAAFTDVDLSANGDAAGDSLDAKGAAAKGQWMGFVRADPNTALVIYVDHVVSAVADKSAGTYGVIDFVIIRLD
jgi:hypothetical protein